MEASTRLARTITARPVVVVVVVPVVDREGRAWLLCLQ